MTAPGRAASTPPPPDADDPRTRTIGIVLIAVAVLIGVVLLAKGFSQEDGLVSTAAPADERDHDHDRTGLRGGRPGAGEETTTTDRGGQRAGERHGARGQRQRQVRRRRHQRRQVEDRGLHQGRHRQRPDDGEERPSYYAPGAQADAQAVATALGLDPAAVAAHAIAATGRPRRARRCWWSSAPTKA